MRMEEHPRVYDMEGLVCGAEGCGACLVSCSGLWEFSSRSQMTCHPRITRVGFIFRYPDADFFVSVLGLVALQATYIDAGA